MLAQAERGAPTRSLGATPRCTLPSALHTARPRALTIAWCQFLIDHTGIPRGRFAPAVSPLDIEDEVLTLLDANDVIRVSARGGGSVKGPSMYVERLAEHVAMPHACLCTCTFWLSPAGHTRALALPETPRVGVAGAVEAAAAGCLGRTLTSPL